VRYTLQVIKDHCESWDDNKRIELADLLSLYACQCNTNNGDAISNVLHRAATSLISSLGNIGSSFDPSVDDPDDEEMKPHVWARKLCTEELALRLNNNLITSLEKIEALSEADIDLYQTKMGTLYIDGEDRNRTTDDSKNNERGKETSGG
jgi:hypothetical protein